MIALFQNLSVADADSYGLVLSALGIGYRITGGQGGRTLWVRETDANDALQAVVQYLDENEEPLSSGDSPPAPLPKSRSGVWVSLALVGIHMVVATGDGAKDLVRTYGSSASLILGGEYYRAVTALMLHGSAVHLFGNAVGMALFGSAVCALNGVGFGWAMILTAGVSGNLLNALFYRSGHVSIGSSTAIFGALGILAAQQSVRILKGKKTRRIKAWAPFAGGLALLGLLGTGERADLMAHLFGFLAGIPLGLLGGNLPKRFNTSRYQHACLVGAAAVVFFSWFIPVMRG